MSSMSEAQLKAAVVRMAHSLDWLVFSMPQAAPHARVVRSSIGYPDLTLARDGRHMFFELKTDAGTLSEAQLRWSRALSPRYHVIRPDALEDGTVERLLV